MPAGAPGGVPRAASPSWLERVIAWAAPDRALARARARVRLAHVRGSQARAYESAARSERTTGWRTPSTGANAEFAGGSLETLRDRSRDHFRNNPYGRRAVRRMTTAVVGGFGMTASFAGTNRRNVEATRAAWRTWSQALTCDARGKHDWAGLQRLMVLTMLQSGEALGLRVWDRAAPFGLRIKILEPDHLEPSGVAGYRQPPDLADGHVVIGGVELDAHEQEVAYWLVPRHPGEWPGPQGRPQRAVRVPASEVIHLYAEERPGAVHNAPLLAPVTIRLRDLDEYDDAQIQKQKIAACWVAFRTRPEGDVGTVAPAAGAVADRMEPAMIESLPAGEEVTFANPPNVQGYDEFETRQLQGCGAGTDVPYEELSGDYSHVNFSSARMGRAAFYDAVEELQWQIVIPRFLNRVWTWFQDAARLAAVPIDGVTVTWTTPRKVLVDPSREVPYAIDGARAGLWSPQEVMRELGYDPEQNLAEWKAFADMVDRLDLVLDIDPRRTTAAGARVAPPTEGLDAPSDALDRPAPPKRGRGWRPAPTANGDTPPGATG